MKTLMRFLTVVLIGLMLSASGQNVITLKYVFPGGSRTATFDTLYGNQTQANAHRLAIRDVNGNLLTGWDAYNLLSQPIWGNGVTFDELLPTLTPEQQPTYSVSNYHPFDPTNLPSQAGMYITRMLIPNDPYHRWMTFQAMPLESAIYWGMIGVEEYKLASLPDFTNEPNPEYLENVAIRAAEKAQYKQILFSTFTMLGDAIFPVMYDNLYPKPQTVTWWLKEGSQWIEIPVVNGKYNVSRKFVPWKAAEDINYPKWNMYVTNTILNPNRVKLLVGLN